MTPTVSHSVDADKVGWIVFDDPASRANVFNPPTQAALHAALDALDRTPVRAVVIVSAKERIFIAGADLKWIAQLPDSAAAADCARSGQRLFQRVADFKVPVVAAIHGACAGGGFELTLACTWRIASSSPATLIGCPEVTIGTIPGWGGCVRLPRLIGAKAALDHILKGALVPASDALRAGLVDELATPEELKARAMAKALELAKSPPTPRAAAPTTDAAYFAEAAAAARKKTRGREPAPLKAIEVIQQGQNSSIADALEIEARAFGETTASAACKNLVHVFFLRDDVKRLTVDAWFPSEGKAAASEKPFRRVGVIGAGVMGSGIAQWCAARGYEVVLRDVKPEFVERGMTVIGGLFDEAVARKKMTSADSAAGLARVRSTTTWNGFAECDLVIEAIVENVAAKQALFAELTQIVRPDCVLASNTSALPIEELASTATHPERTIGVHFFNPVSRMPLVELVLSPKTSRVTAERTLAFVKGLGKSPVICRSSPGFLVTRVLFFYLNEACRRWEQGLGTEVIDQALREWGWPMGPMRLIDEVGVDVTDFIFGEMAHYFPGRFQRSEACGRLLAAGLKGRKNGASRGFYRYEGGREIVNDAETRGLTQTVAKLDAPSADEIARALNRVMSDEAGRCLSEGVIKSPNDVDFALLMGAGFPPFRGGLMREMRG